MYTFKGSLLAFNPCPYQPSRCPLSKEGDFFFIVIRIRTFLLQSSKLYISRYRIQNNLNFITRDYSDPFYPFNDVAFNEWNIRYPKFTEDLANYKWESLKINDKQRSRSNEHSHLQQKPQQWNFERLRSTKPLPQHRSRKKPVSSSWWSYDCRFQNYGSYSSFHVMCYFLGPSFVHYHNYHNKHFTTTFL